MHYQITKHRKYLQTNSSAQFRPHNAEIHTDEAPPLLKNWRSQIDESLYLSPMYWNLAVCLVWSSTSSYYHTPTALWLSLVAVVSAVVDSITNPMFRYAAMQCSRTTRKLSRCTRPWKDRNIELTVRSRLLPQFYCRSLYLGRQMYVEALWTYW